MIFRYIIETESKNGTKETSVTEFDKGEILVGRGTSCDLILSGRLVSLEHALLKLGRDRLSLRDLGSLSGVSVNSSFVQTRELKRGDQVKIGEYVFKVIHDDSGWGFVESRVESEDDEDLETFIKRQEKALRFQNYLPSFTVLSLVCIAAVLLFFGIMPLAGANRMSWSSGPISNAHKMIEDDCAQCHDSAFIRVKDDRCLACHQMSNHADNLAKLFDTHPDLNARCASCHMEHNGDQGIIAEESKLCTDCHGVLSTLLPNTTVADIESLGEHPEFRVSIDGRRVSLSEKKELKDLSKIKLNHKIHLEPDLAGADGLVTLSCSDCHRLTDDMIRFKAISFSRDCKSCHPLEFDPRLPGEEVPHGEPDAVYNYLYAEYAKLFLRKEGKDEGSDANISRRKPGGQEVDRGTKIEFSRTTVEKESRAMEESLFTDRACHLCHMVREREDGQSGVREGLGKYDVVKPDIPQLWMPASIFDHGAHLEVACESCHQGVRESSETTDVLLPGVDNCRQCHQQGGDKSFVNSDCAGCHSYHDSLEMEEGKKREIEKILLGN